jgi:hypothetical protein
MTTVDNDEDWRKHSSLLTRSVTIEKIFITSTPQTYFINILFLVNYDQAKQARVLIPGKSFQVSLRFESKAGTCYCGAPARTRVGSWPHTQTFD